MTMPPDPVLNPYGTRGEPSVNNPVPGQVDARGQPILTPAPATTNAANTPTVTSGNPQYDQLIADATRQIDQYAGQLTTLSNQVQQASSALARMDASDPGYAAVSRNYDSLNASYVSAMNNLARAYDNRIATATKALDSRWMQPSQQALWEAQANKDKADADKTRADIVVLNETKGPQHDLLIAQAAQTSAQGRLAEAQAGNLTAKTPAEIAGLQANANQANSSASLAQTQAAALQATLPTAGRKAEAETVSLEQAALDAIRKNTQAPTNFQAAQANQAAVDNAMALAKQAVNTAQRQVLGPTFGLQDQLAAIKQIADGVKSGAIPWTGDPAHLDQMLSQYLSATLGGTTVSGAAGQAESALEAGQASLQAQRQQTIGLIGQGMQAGAGITAGGLGQLMGLAKDMPAGTQLGGAVSDLFRMGSDFAAQPQFRPPPVVQPSALPPFLQGFAAPAPAPQGPSTDPASVAAAAVHAAVSAAQQPSTPAAAAPQAPAPSAFAQSGMSEGGSTTEGGSRGMPGILQPHAPPDADFMPRLWGRAA